MKKLILIAGIMILILSACGVSQQEAQATANSAVLTALANQPAANTAFTPTALPLPTQAFTLTATIAPLPTSTVVPTQAAAYNPPINQTGCLEGEVPGNYTNDLTRTPVGLGENVSLVEASWRIATNKGVYDYARVNYLINALGTDYQVFLLNMATIHMNRYCGTLDQVRNYVGFPEASSGMPPHVRSMRQTAADSKGKMPDAKSICVVEVDLVSGTLKVLWDCPLGPSLDEIKSHIEIVKVNNP